MPRRPHCRVKQSDRCTHLAILLCKKLTALHVAELFLFRPRIFSRALGRGSRGGGACTPRCKCGSRPDSVARALGVQSREIWQVTTESLSDQPEPSRSIETPRFSYFSLSALCQVLVSHRPSSSQAFYSVAATIQQQSHMNLLILSRPLPVLV